MVISILIFLQFGFLLGATSATLALYTVRYRIEKKQLYSHIIAVALSYLIMAGLLLTELVSVVPANPKVKVGATIVACALGDYALLKILIFQLQNFFQDEKAT